MNKADVGGEVLIYSTAGIFNIEFIIELGISVCVAK